jgi:hypothetical protein
MNIEDTKPMGIENINITSCSVDDRRKIVAAYEAKLAEEKARRDKILADIRETTARADMGDQRARFAQGGLNKEDAAAGRLILSLEAQVAEAKKRLDAAMNQAGVAEARQAESDSAPVPHDKLFETVCPDGRRVRHRHHSFEALQKALQPGYLVAGQVFGANADDTGGIVSRPGAPSMLKALLESHGDELVAFLAERGIIGSDKTVIVLPASGRELQ